MQATIHATDIEDRPGGLATGWSVIAAKGPEPDAMESSRLSILPLRCRRDRQK